jgi:ketosteroid isomerase-like protein
MRIPVCFSLILICLVVSCGSSEDKAIEETLSVRNKAYETKDVDLYMTLIAPDYKQEKKGKTIGVEEVKKNFLTNVSLFDTIDLTNSDRAIYRDGDKAEVAQITLVNAVVNNTKSRFKINDRIVLEKRNGKWLIVKESDADFLEGFVFGGNH